MRTLATGMLIVLTMCAATTAHGLDIVADEKAHATIVVEGGAPKPNGKAARGRGAAGDGMAAEVLASWIRKMTGAELPIAAQAPADGAVIYVGQAAVKAGLKLDEIQSSTHEGLRVVCDGKRILLAGQNGTATVKAACRLLEEMGCRYLMDSPMGEVYPHATTLNLKEMDLREKPGLALRQMWGSNWSGDSLWKIWNGVGGAQYPQGHAWGAYVPKRLFETHPEYFAMHNGERKRGDWYCTSNPELRKVFAEGVMRALEKNGGVGASISPPDGTGYCECDKCRAQDDPQSIEPSSGHVSVTDRYAEFFNDVARRVKEKYPDAKLNFYCYADYTQAPTRGLKLEPNLVAWIAPLRYCRLHAIGNPICPSRVQLGEMIDDWSKATGNIAYRTYNYNLAECTVPFSMVSIWKHDIPYLKEHGAIGINLETLPSWQIYGPHLYLSLRLAYDPVANADALLDDYMTKFYGPAAGPLMKRYWMDIDKAFAGLHCHAGSFFAVHRVYTPEFLEHSRMLLKKAKEAVGDDPVLASRVAMHAEGFKNAEQYAQLRDAMNSGRTAEMQKIYEDLLARTTAQTAAGYSNHYTPDYVKRFLGKDVEAGAAATAGANRVVMVLPDQMRLAYDEKDEGAAKGYAKTDFDDSAWKSVATFSDTLDGQGLPDRKTIIWYRATVDVPKVAGKLSLFFVEVDGAATVFINGAQSGGVAKKRVPFEVDGAGLHAGKNRIAVRVDHSAISELFLGGIVRPIYLVEKGAAAEREIHHYVFFNRDREQISEANFLETKAFEGAQIKYTWRQLEHGKDGYDFDDIEHDLAYLKSKGKKLFIQIQDASFDVSIMPVPKYLVDDPQYHGGADKQYEIKNDDEEHATPAGWVARRWDPAVRERFGQLLAALGAKFDGRIEGINLPETAVDFGESGKLYPKGFTPDVYRDAVIANMEAMKKAFPKSVTMQYANFMPGDDWEAKERVHLKAVYERAKELKVGVGGPDLLPYRPGQLKNSYPLLREFSGSVPTGIAVQEGNYSQTNPTTGKPVTIEELVRFGSEYLKVDYVFWCREEPFYSRDVVGMMRDEKRKR